MILNCKKAIKPKKKKLQKTIMLLDTAFLFQKKNLMVKKKILKSFEKRKI